MDAILLNEKWLAIAVTVLAIGLILLVTSFADPERLEEPPVINPSLPFRIPFIGHLIHLFRQGADYFSALDEKYGYGLYTLPVLRGRIYIVNSPEWALAMHKATKTLSFNTLVLQAMRTVFGFDDKHMAIIEQNANGEDGDRSGMMLETHDMMFGGFHNWIDELNGNFLKCWTPHINSLAPNPGSETIGLWSWIQHHFSIAAAASLYGPSSPLSLNSSLVDDFWTFENSIDKLFTYPCPSITMPKAFAARQRVFDAFSRYGEEERCKQPGTSRVIQARATMMEKYGFTKQMFGQGETSMLFAALINTAPVTFWLLSYILADPELHAGIRSEIDACITPGAENKRVLNATKLRNACPLFSSTLRETLRFTATMNINRWVSDDTPLTNASTGETVLLKKGNMVSVAANVMHFDQEIWGGDAGVFNARRFMPMLSKGKSETEAGGKNIDIAATFRDAQGKLHGGAFRSFGGGNNVCPGRQFAQTEIQTVAALFIAGFDVTMADESQYVAPPFEPAKMIAGVWKPARDVQIRIERRHGYEEVEWRCEI